jgi:hypothetical protein
MRGTSRAKVAVLLVAGVALGGCESQDRALLAPEGVAERWNEATPRPAASYRAHLSGAAELPDGVDTRAQGQALFQLSEDGTELSYRLIVADIDDVFMSHIHLAAADANGPVVVWLYPSAPPPVPIDGRFSGVLAEGVITAAELVGPLAGQSLADLAAAIEAGNTYVNVHTAANPGGEVRGQIR